MYRTDRHNNPAAFTTDIAKQAGLALNVDYVEGEPFAGGFHTAKLLGDPIELTIRVINAVGYFTKAGGYRWTYIALPKFLWDSLDYKTRVKVIGYHYQREGGTAMKDLFV